MKEPEQKDWKLK